MAVQYDSVIYEELTEARIAMPFMDVINGIWFCSDLPVPQVNADGDPDRLEVVVYETFAR